MSDAHKSRDELLLELATLRQGRESCENVLCDHRRMEHDLLERVKELNCLYGITRIAQRADRPLPELAGEIAALICSSWQYPEITCACLTLDGQEFASPDFRRTDWCQASPVAVRGEIIGRVEVCYLEERPECGEGPFLREERHLIDAVADLVGRIVSQRRAEEQMRELWRQLIKAQENERQRIARELHDHVAQNLSMAKSDLERLAAALPQGESARQQATDVVERLSDAIGSIRDLAYGLLPPGLTELGLVDTMLRHCEEFSQRHGLPVEVFADGMQGLKLNFDTQINVYRLIQEALSNARRHAAASRVTVRLIASYPELLVRIEDDGRGADLDQCLARAGQEKRMGLISMRERVKLLGGRITFRSKPGKGMRILAEVPCAGGKRGA